MRFYAFFFLLLFSFSSQAQFDGVWASKGYGILLDVSGTLVDEYQYTSISNIYDDSYVLQGNALGQGEDLVGFFSLQDSLLLLTLTGGTVISFEPLSALPPITQESDDPQLNFDVFWQTYQDWCALFPILNVDWEYTYDLYASQIDASTSNAELFGFMAEMLDQLNDGHSYLEGNGSQYFEGGPDVNPLWDEYAYDLMDLIEEDYIDGGNYEVSESELLYYGTIRDSIGYLCVYEMEGYAEAGNELDDNLAFSEELDEALSWLGNTQALVLDLRFNTGGYDSNARILGNRLTTEVKPVYSKQVRLPQAYDLFSDSLVFYVEPQGVQYLNRPVVVLTSDLTLSAADVAAMLLKEIDCVTLVGEPTYGIFSDNYTKYLPNGWEFGISPERYKDIYGLDHEQQGIFPDVYIAGSLTSFLYADRDNILDFALDTVFSFCVSSFTVDVEEGFVRVFPNPTQDQLQVEIDGQWMGPCFWSIWNAQGRRVLRGREGVGSFVVDIAMLPSGKYFLQLDSESGEAWVESFSVDR